MKRESQLSQNGLKSVQSLQTFKLLSSEIAPIYYEASSLPPFLQSNLRSEHRIVKQFQGDDCLLKVFYFSLMKLAFEIECEQKDYVSLVKKILLSQQEFGVGELEDKSLRDGQYRKFLLEFIQILANQEVPSFEETVQWYPIVDEILHKMFKKLVPVTLLLKDTSDFSIAKRVFQFLSQKFMIKLQVISGCFKFVESDIFVYIQNLQHVFVIFVDQLAFIKEVTEEQSSHLANNTSKLASVKEEQSDRILEGISSQQSLVKDYSNRSQQQAQKNSRKDNPRQDSRQSGKDNHRPFNTVINMLDSKYSSTDKSHLASSMKYRSSFDNNFQNVPKPRLDKVKQKNALFQDYYGTETNKNKLEAQISSLSTIKGQPSVNSNKSSILADYKSIEEMKSLGSPSKQIKKQMFHTSISRNNILNSNLHQTYAQPQTLPKSLGHNSNLCHFSGKLQCKSKDKYEIKRTLNIVIKPQQQFSRELTSPGNSKNSNLGLFSKVNKKGSANCQPKIYPKKEEETVSQDTSYEKFTNSGLLEILDEEYKAQIKSIKQKYRQHRNNVKKYI